MARDTLRHAPRHAAPRRAGASAAPPGSVSRPLLASGVAAGLLVAGAVAGSLPSGTASAETLAFAVDRPTVTTSVEQSRMERADAMRVAADRSATNARRSVAAARSAERARIKAATVAKARKAAAARAARAAARKRVVADAQKNPKAAARMLLPEFGFSQAQWPCLERLWTGESDWNYKAANSSSGAYGIPQSLPGRKMATVAGDWRTNPVTQLKWGLNYIRQSYGTPCNALDVWNSHSPHWY